MRWRCNPAGPPIATFQNLPSPSDWPLFRPDRHQYSGDISDHVIQKSISFDVDPNPWARTTNLKRPYFPSRLSGLAGIGAVRREIMTAHQSNSRFSHLVNVETSVIPGDLSRQKGRPHRPGENNVAVRPTDRTEACMKAGTHRNCPGHYQAGGCQRIGTPRPSFKRPV